MVPRPDVSKKRKNQIIEAAIKVFSELGFQNARMDDIAEESGLSKGSLYWYFESKDDIILTILDHLFDQELFEWKDLAQIESSAKRRLQDFLEHTIYAFKDMRHLMPVILEFYALTLRRDQVQEVFKGYLNNYLQILVPVIQQGINQKEFRPVDPEEAAIAILANFEGTILLWAYDPQKVDLVKHWKSGANLLIEGLENRN
jgi:TetR/AcrR family fatty acid metabolism transcriptional regulator